MHRLNLYHCHLPDLTDDEVIAVRRQIAREVLSELAREWADSEPVTVAGLVRQLVREIAREV